MSEAVRQATCVAIDGRAVLIEGAPGAGKSSLALALIDRGAVLVGDDGVMIEAIGGELIARPHPRTRGLLEVRGVGLVAMPVADGAPVALIVLLDPAAPRFVEAAEAVAVAAIELPMVRFNPVGSSLALRAELALARHGLCRS